MSEQIGHINYGQEDFAQGLNRLGFTGYLLPQTEGRMLDEVYDHAVYVLGNPQVNIWGIRGESSPYDQNAPDGDTLFVDLVDGKVSFYPVLPPGNMGDFQQEQEAFRSHWSRLKDLKRHDSTDPVLDRLIATATILNGTRDTIRDVYEAVCTVPLDEFSSNGANPNAIVFDRFAEAIRIAYGQGRDKEAFALASVIPRIARLDDRTWKASEGNGQPSAIKLSLGNDVWKLFENFRGQEARTLQLRALERILEQGENSDVNPLTELERGRIRLLRAALVSGYAITKMTTEVTLYDIRTYPSNANPRPDLGIPEYGGTRWLMGGPESDNTAIIYPDGKVYLGDMPTYGVTRVITPEIAEDEKLHGELVDGKFVGIGANRMPNPGVTSGRVSLESELRGAYSEVVERLTQIDHDKLYAAHRDALGSLCEQYGFTPEVLKANSTNSKLGFATGRQLFEGYVRMISEMAKIDPTRASALFDFGFSGWGSRDEAEAAVGLDHADAPNDYLYMEWSRLIHGAFRDYNSQPVRAYFNELREQVKQLSRVLMYQRLQALKLSMPKHAQIKEYVDGLPEPDMSVDEAIESVLEQHGRFNDDWLREEQEA